MTISLTNGATVQTWCDGVGYRGQVGYMIGPTQHDGLARMFSVQRKQPLRALNSIPLPRNLATGDLGFSVYRLFNCEQDAQEWAYYTWPETCLRSGMLSLYTAAKRHVDLANCVLSKLTCVPDGVAVEVSFAFQCSAATLVIDP